MDYERFLENKKLKSEYHGFDCIKIPDFLYDFQKELVSWSIKKGKAAIFAECGLGKTPMQLVWAQKILEKTNKPILILTPLAVSQQTKREGSKFGIDVNHTRDSKIKNCINVTNYEKLHYYNPNDFSGIVLDESSIIKNYAGKFRDSVTRFMDKIPYRLLCTATPSPNDHMELGTSSEALGEMSRKEMLSVFFTHNSGATQDWSLKGHAQEKFWQWMSTWSRAIRKPSDIGFDDNDFILPNLNIIQDTVKSNITGGRLFATEAVTLNDQRQERKETIISRCEKVAEIANKKDCFLCWTSFNDESAMLTKLIDGAVEIKGSDKDEYKEEMMLGFSSGNIKCLVTKPKIAGFGMNWQHCSDMSFFPSHSYEQFYQAVRRCWRFGQKEEVNCHVITTERESRIVDSLRRKEDQSDVLYNGIISGMNKYQNNLRDNIYNNNTKMEIPKWM